MKTIVGTLFIFVAGIMLSGCKAVYTESPIGEKTADLTNHDLDGVWIAGDGSDSGALTFKVLDKEAGTMMVAWIELTDDEFELVKFKGFMRKQGDWLVGHIVDEENPKIMEWLIVKLSSDKIEAYIPSASDFRELIKSGIVEGKELKGGSVQIPGLPAEVFDKLVKDRELNAFVWDDPLILVRPRMNTN